MRRPTFIRSALKETALLTGLIVAPLIVVGDSDKVAQTGGEDAIEFRIVDAATRTRGGVFATTILD
jgi:hypothetical protein